GSAGGGRGLRCWWMLSLISPAATAIRKQLKAATAAQPSSFSQGRRRFPAKVDVERRNSIAEVSLGVPYHPDQQHPIDEEAVMKWTKPAFKTLELASEVTAYRYSR
ncbi:MAG TPA: pyrroloquinoline quinone precursor peptide PqqA, partial [Solirubrobacterales bacterium]